MKIDSDRLRTIRKRKKLSRPDLERVSGINVRTIQRLENEPEKSKTTREDTVMRLAEALDVKPGVLTGELDLPDADEATIAEPDPVRIGAQIPPKIRLAYDLIKRRYGVNATDVITMAPLFFALLAEGSLAHRREELDVAKNHWAQIKSSHGVFGAAEAVAAMNAGAEEESIDKNDIFGEHLLSDNDGMTDVAFDPSEDNPFARYLWKLATVLEIPGVIHLVGGKLSFGSPAEFPDYDIWNDEVERITNGSTDARRALETGFARLSEIPEQLVSDGKGEERQKLLEDSLPDLYRGAKEEDPAGELARIQSLSPQGDRLREAVKELSEKKQSGIK